MKQSQTMKPEFRRTKWVTASLLLLGLAFACGESSSPESGETHFLTRCDEGSCGTGFECVCGVCSRKCEANASCDGLPGAATCIEQPDSCGAPIACDVRCTSDADCAKVGANHRCEEGACRAGEATPAPGCGEGCVPVFANPEDPALGAVDLSREIAIGCSCDPQSIDGLDGSKRCVRRPDGRLLLAPWVDFTALEPLADCTAEETARTTSSTDFAGCSERPQAACSVDAFCEVMACGGVEFDENGCVRQRCETDADCAATEECTPVESVTVGNCQTQAGSCQCGGTLPVAPAGAFCTPRPPLGELCDGSNEVRLFVHAGGGFVEDSYEFMNPYGSSVLVVLGTCEYYAQPDGGGEWITGTMSETSAQALARELQFERVPEFSSFRDRESCPDAGAQYLQVPGAWVMCTCGCGDGAPAGLEDAMVSASLATTAYGLQGDPLTGGSVRVVARVHTEVSDTPPASTPQWSLGFPITDALLPGGGAVPRDAGVRVDDAADVTELRRLRREYPSENTASDYVFVQDSTAAVYVILVRDELPTDVAAGVAALEGELEE
jgi:hypothetical protein